MNKYKDGKVWKKGIGRSRLKNESKHNSYSDLLHKALLRYELQDPQDPMYRRVTGRFSRHSKSSKYICFSPEYHLRLRIESIMVEQLLMKLLEQIF